MAESTSYREDVSLFRQLRHYSDSFPGFQSGWEGAAWVALMRHQGGLVTLQDADWDDFESLLRDRLTVIRTCGACSFARGDAGVLVVTDLAAQLNKDRFQSFLPKALELVYSSIESLDHQKAGFSAEDVERSFDNDFSGDFLHGLPGAFVALASLQATTVDRQKLQQMIDKISTSYTLRLELSQPILGLAHGLAGGLLVLEMAKSLGFVVSSTVTEACFQLILKNEQSLPDGTMIFPIRSGEGAEGTIDGWCHGAPGIALVSSIAYSYTSSRKYMELAKRYTAHLRKLSPLPHNVCCGGWGRMHVGLSVCHHLALEDTDIEKAILTSLAQSEEWKNSTHPKGDTTLENRLSLYKGQLGYDYLLDRLKSREMLPFPMPYPRSPAVRGKDKAHPLPKSRGECTSTFPFQPLREAILRVASVPMEDACQLLELEDDRTKESYLLHAFDTDPVLRTAIALASPSMGEVLDDTSRPCLKPSHLETLVKYFVRAGSRPTPFGLLSGITSVQIGKESRLKLPSKQLWKARAEFEIEVLERYWRSFLDSSMSSPNHKILINPSLRLVGKFINFETSSRELDKDTTVWGMVSLRHQDLFEKIATWSSIPITISNLAFHIREHTGVSVDQAQNYIRQLISLQYLQLHDPIVLNSNHLLDSIERAVAAVNSDQSYLNQIGTWKGALERINQGPVTEMRRSLESLVTDPVQVTPSAERVLNVILHVPQPLSLESRIVTRVHKSLEELWTITERRENLKEYRDAFVERFGQSFIPLNKVVDSDWGLGFPLHRLRLGTLLKKAQLSDPASNEDFTGRFSKREMKLLDYLYHTWSFQGYELVLSSEKVKELSSVCTPLPESVLSEIPMLTALVSLGSLPDTSLGDAPFTITGSWNPIRLVGRFGVLPELRTLLEQWVSYEEQFFSPDICAEVLLGSRWTKEQLATAQRPNLYKYEIPAGGWSPSGESTQILPSDLFVGVVNGKIKLWSEREGRFVRPRFSASVAFDPKYQPHNLISPLQQFLGSLVDAEGSVPYWSWGALITSPFLPRVVSRHGVVYSPALWNLSQMDLQELVTAKSLKTAVTKLRAAKNIPRFISSEEASRIFLMDLESTSSLGFFMKKAYKALADKKSLTISEYLPIPGTSPVKGDKGGTYAHEFVIPFAHTAERPPRTSPAHSPVVIHNPELPIVSHWTYCKVYLGESFHEYALIEFSKLIKELKANGAIDRWFFIRYQDPKPHLRVRVRSQGDSNQITALLMKVASRLRDELGAYRIELPSYEREVERYGGLEGLDIVEQIFDADSTCAAQLAGCILTSGDPDHPWLIPLLSCSKLLRVLSPNWRKIVEDLVKGYGTPYGLHSDLPKSVSGILRKDGKGIQEWMGESPSTDERRTVHACINARDEIISSLNQELIRLHEGRKLMTDLDSIYRSIIHLSSARYFATSLNKQETILYYLLKKIAASTDARTR